MARYRCPDCSGGFPELPPEKECPWCGESMNGHTTETKPPIHELTGKVPDNPPSSLESLNGLVDTVPPEVSDE